MWHSGLLKRGSFMVGIIIGARSAMMLEYKNLGMIAMKSMMDPKNKHKDPLSQDMAVSLGHYEGYQCLLMPLPV